MNRLRLLIPILISIALLLTPALVLAEDAFPPAARLRANSSYWTSVHKSCDSTWSDFRSELAKIELPEDKAVQVKKLTGDAIAARVPALIAISQSAAEYYTANRGAVIYKRFKDYGSTIKLSDGVLIQDTLDFYCDICSLFAKNETEKIEELVANRIATIVNLTRIKSKLDPEVLNRYYDITATLGEKVFAIVKALPDIATARAILAELSVSIISFADEFFLCTPSGFELFVYEDSQQRCWLQFDAAPRNPYFSTENLTDGKLRTVTPEEDVVAQLLAKLRTDEDAYRKITHDAVLSILKVLPDDHKAKLQRFADQLAK